MDASLDKMLRLNVLLWLGVCSLLDWRTRDGKKLNKVIKSNGLRQVGRNGDQLRDGKCGVNDVELELYTSRLLLERADRTRREAQEQLKN